MKERERAVPACRAEAVGYARAGMRAVREAGAVELRKELVDALDGDPEMSEAFAALTPGGATQLCDCVGIGQSIRHRGGADCEVSGEDFAGYGRA